MRPGIDRGIYIRRRFLGREQCHKIAATRTSRSSSIRRFFASSGPTQLIEFRCVLPKTLTGEAALSVTIFLREARRRMSGRPVSWTRSSEVATALRKIGDYRFPYVTFLAPDYEQRRGRAFRRVRLTMWSLVQHQLENARLLATHDKSRPRPASLRRAVSTAYYAVFQALCATCADTLVKGHGPWEVYTPVFRAPDHYCDGADAPPGTFRS